MTDKSFYRYIRKRFAIAIEEFTDFSFDMRGIGGVHQTLALKLINDVDDSSRDIGLRYIRHLRKTDRVLHDPKYKGNRHHGFASTEFG